MTDPKKRLEKIIRTVLEFFAINTESGKIVSTPVPENTIIRAYIECPECVSKITRSVCADEEARDKAIAQFIKRIGFASIAMFLIMLFLLLIK